MQDRQFYSAYLSSSRRYALRAVLKSLKDNIIAETDQPEDLKELNPPNTGEGQSPRNLSIDQIFVNLLIYEGREKYEFPKDRREQLKVFPIPKEVQWPDREVSAVRKWH